jgi:type II secretory pathway pseudopilin PulG
MVGLRGIGPLMDRKFHPGFSLLEVVLAAAILAATAFLLSQIAGFVRGSLEKLELQTEAQLLCQSKLAEIVAGVEPLQQVSREPFPGKEGWYHSVETSPTEFAGLLSVRVSTWFERENLSGTAAGSGSAQVVASCSIVRWIRDPNRVQTRSEGTDLGLEGRPFSPGSEEVRFERGARRSAETNPPRAGPRSGFGGIRRSP